MFTCPTRAAARKLRSKTFRYVFTHATAKALAGRLGATHAIEIPFVFDTQANPTPEEKTLSRAVLGAVREDR